jgi:tetratricopeptide (TPR) repeat protein
MRSTVQRSRLLKRWFLEEEENMRLLLQCCRLKMFHEAEMLAGRIVDERGKILGRFHESTLCMKYVVAWMLLMGRRMDFPAEAMAHEAVDGAERISGVDHDMTLESKAKLGEILLYRKHYGDAETLLREVVDGFQQKSMPNTEQELEAEAKMLLGNAFYLQHKYGEAEELFRHQLDWWSKIGRGGDEVEGQMLETKAWLARTLYRQRKYSDAERLFRDAKDGFMLLYGNDERTIMTVFRLSKTIYHQKRFAEAQELLRQTIVGCEDIPSKGDELVQTLKKLREMLKLWFSPSLFDPAATVSQGCASRLESLFQKRKKTRESYTDSAIIEIASLLGSKVPRTYIVLRTIDHLNLLDDIINAGFSDFWFPVTKQRLPECLSTSARTAFCETQYIILTKSMDLEKGQTGQHCHFDEDGTLPLQEQGILGTGGFGQVDRVTSLISFKTYARKRVRRSHAFRDRKDHINLFIDEIQLLKRLRHHHITKFVGSYTDTTYIGLIMSPVAETDLGRYLTDCTAARHPELRTFFGCLATALEFLHMENVRHKDIKPSNILVERSGNVLFTDFGLSLDFTDASGSTTAGMVRHFTPRYCAPEVADREKRNTKSDIWSLGIVFMEMIVVLKGKTRQDMDAFFDQRGSEQTYIHANIDTVPDFISELEGIGQLSDNSALGWVRQMLRKKQRLRPTASFLVTTILESTGFCGICCKES